MSLIVQKIWNNRIIRIAIIVCLALMAVLSLVQGCRNASVYSQDFQWDAAKAFSMKIDPYDESLNPSGALNADGIKEFYDYFESIDAPQKMEANQFPSLLMILLPMTVMSPITARYVWIVLNVLFAIGIVFLMRKTFFKDASAEIFAVTALLMAAGTPFRNHLGVGQHTIFSVFFFLLAVYLAEQKQKGMWVLSGISLSVSYFKYTLTAPLAIYFIYKKKYKEFTISVLIHIVLTAVSAWWLNESVVDMIVKPLKVSSALSAEGGLDLGALFNGSPIAFALAFVIMAVLLFIAVRLPENMDAEIMSVLVLWSLIILYHRTYDFFVLVIAASFVIKDNCPKYLRYLYAVTLISVFFVLRVFSESLYSRIGVGIIYYCLTVLATIYVLKKTERNQ